MFQSNPVQMCYGHEFFCFVKFSRGYDSAVGVSSNRVLNSSPHQTSVTVRANSIRKKGHLKVALKDCGKCNQKTVVVILEQAPLTVSHTLWV